MNKKEIILIGGGGHCSSCIDVIEQDNTYRIAGIIDVADKVGSENLGYTIIGTDEQIPELLKKYRYFLVTLGHIRSPEARIRLFEQVRRAGGVFPVIVSPNAYVSKHASIGDGTIIMHHATVNARAKVGRNCIINSKALVEHDAWVGDHCHISTASVINGHVTVGEGTFFGSGAISKHAIEIAPKSFIQANSFVR